MIVFIMIGFTMKQGETFFIVYEPYKSWLLPKVK